MSRKEKSAWLGAAEADYDEQSENSLPDADGGVNEAPKPPDEPKDFATLRAQFALRGRALTRSHRVPCGRITFVVTSWAGERYFSHLHDVQGHLNQVASEPWTPAKLRGDAI
jgi:hypothetical protein